MGCNNFNQNDVQNNVNYCLSLLGKTSVPPNFVKGNTEDYYFTKDKPIDVYYGDPGKPYSSLLFDSFFGKPDTAYIENNRIYLVILNIYGAENDMSADTKISAIMKKYVVFFERNGWDIFIKESDSKYVFMKDGIYVGILTDFNIFLPGYQLSLRFSPNQYFASR